MQNSASYLPPSKFDWYRGSTDTSPELVAQVLKQSFDNSIIERRSPRFGYEQGASVLSPDGTELAFMMWGGNNVGTRTFLEASGNKSPQFAEMMRDSFKDHILLRGDVATDFMGGKADFESISKVMVQQARKHNVTTSTVGDWMDAKRGRTLYVGNRKSPVMMRLYEKGIKEKELELPDLVRLEIEVKPKTVEARTRYAAMPPEAYWGASRFAQAITNILGAKTDLQPSAGSIYTPSDNERAWQWMLKQYKNAIAYKAEQLGGCPQALGLALLGIEPD